MARISAHGSEIGTVHYATHSIKYMSDGKILRNQGFGWKIAGKVKDDATPREAFERRVEKQNATLAARPAFAAYRKLLHAMAGVGKRWKLQAAVSLMPDDADGVWSEACDGYGDNIHADLDEVSELCRAYKAALMEADEIKKAKAAAA